MPRLARPPAPVLAAIILVLLLVVASISVASVRRYENFLSGLWVGDPGFLRKAQLDDFQLFLAPSEDGRRQGYLIITDTDGAYVSNQAIEVRVGSAARRWSSALRSAFKAEGDAYKACSFEIEFDADGSPVPSQMKMALSILDGTLTLYDGEKVYAFLAKDPTASAAALAAWAAD
jgi:hypothetical protein